MALEDIIKKIIEDAQHEADAEKRRAQKEVKDIQKETEILKGEYLLREDVILRERHDSVKRERVAMHRQKMKSRVDREKRELLDRVFFVAEESISSLSDDERYLILARSIGSIDERMQDGEVLVSARDESMVKKILAEKSIGIPVRVSESVVDGCVIRSDGFEYDFRFSEMLKNKKRSLEPEVAKMIFQV